MNAYEVKAGMVFIAGKTVRSMPECFKVICIPCKALYKCSALLFLNFIILPSCFEVGFCWLLNACQIHALSLHMFDDNGHVVSVCIHEQEYQSMMQFYC